MSKNPNDKLTAEFVNEVFKKDPHSKQAMAFDRMAAAVTLKRKIAKATDEIYEHWRGKKLV